MFDEGESFVKNSFDGIRKSRSLPATAKSKKRAIKCATSSATNFFLE
jgi:hypothetical protein